MNKFLIVFLTFTFVSSHIFAQNNPKSKNWSYPEIKPDTAIDYYFGQKVIDPYRNLENFEDTLVKTWVKSQNEFYDTIINNITNHGILNAEIGKMKKLRKKWVDFPRIVSNRYFYPFGFFGDNDIERLGYTDSLHKEPIELFNTKEINEKDKSVYTINYYEPSPDGKYIAFGVYPNGNEKASIYILDLEKKELLSEKIEYSIGGNIQWLSNNSGFFYVKDKDIITEEDKNTYLEDAIACFHKLHTSPANDKQIFSRLLSKNVDVEKINRPRLHFFPSSDKVLINLAKGSYYVVYYANLKDVLEKPAEEIVWKKICGREAKMSSNALYGNRFFGLAYGQNPNGQLITMMLPDTTPKVVYNATDFILDDLALTPNSLYVSIIENGLNKLVKINLKNYKTENVKLPFLGGIKLNPWFQITSSYHASDNLLFSLTNYDKQRDYYSLDKNKHIIKTDIIPEIKYTVSPLDLVVEEIEVPSHDGAMVPLSIVYKKGTALNGKNLTLIEAYGAYGVLEKPEFKRDRIAWFNHGGIYAVAHVRGGGEKGDNWYKGGFKATKANSWKDLIACAEYLIKNKYTSSKNLAASGASAGGITVGRAITERPDLFKAAVIYVGSLNTLRTEYTFNPSVDEYGSAKDSLGFEYLYNMDTYHHIKEGVSYPSVLFTAGINDSRVAPWQAAKAVAQMQQVGKGDNIVLFRVANTGHFENPSDADVYSFLFWQLGHPDFKLQLNKDLNK